jgi:hypothetical protein
MVADNFEFSFRDVGLPKSVRPNCDLFLGLATAFFECFAVVECSQRQEVVKDGQSVTLQSERKGHPRQNARIIVTRFLVY